MWEMLIDRWELDRVLICLNNDSDDLTYNNIFTFEQWLNKIPHTFLKTSFYQKEAQEMYQMLKQYSLVEIIDFFKDELHETYDKLVDEYKKTVESAQNKQETED